jgi:hypothetical protein
MRTRITGIAVLIGLAAGLSPIALSSDQTSVAEAAAKDNAATPDGRKYGETVGQAFGREHGVTVRECAKSIKRPELSDFDLFLRIEPTGGVEEVLVKPRTNISSCIQGKLARWKAPRPPHAGFWVKIAVNLKRK